MGGRQGWARGSHWAWVIYSLIYSALHISELPGLARLWALGGGTDRTSAPAVLGKEEREQSGRLPGGDDARAESCSLLSKEEVSGWCWQKEEG